MASPKVRPGIMDLTPYVAGNTGLPENMPVANLAANENCLGSSDAARAAYRDMAALLHEYPDGAARALRSAIAAQTGLDAERIVCGAGSDELITLLIRAYAGPGDEIIQSAHGFLMYGITAQSVGAVPVKTAETDDLVVDIDAMIAAVTDKTRIVFIANPNNPTGSVVPTDALYRLRDGLREDILLVIDSAYAEYCDTPNYNAGEALVDAYDNVVMLRTFSKIHGLAALRVGWGYFPAAIADVMNRVRGPFNVCAPALAAAEAAIADTAFISGSITHNATWRGWLADELEKQGLTVYPSQGNFLLVRFADADQAQGAWAHLRDHGVLVRPVGGYGLPDCLRMTIGLEDDMKKLVKHLSGWLEG